MLNVIIADDERLDAQLICRLADWGALNMRVAAVTSGGAETLREIERHEPDILITDILMPGVGGIELAAEVRRCWPGVQILFASGHREFTYAQQGIDAGVGHYFLKPVDREELNRVLAAIGSKCAAEKKRRLEEVTFKRFLDENMPAFREAFLNKWAGGYYRNARDVAERLEFYGIELAEEGLAAVIVRPDAPQAGVNGEYGRRMDQYKLREAIDEAACDLPHALFHLERSDDIAILQNAAPDRFHAQMSGLISRVASGVSLLCPFTVTIGVGPLCFSYIDLPGAIKAAELAVGNRFFVGDGQAIFYDDITQGEPLPFRAPAHREALLKSLFSGEPEALSGAVAGLKTDLAACRVGPEQARLCCIEIISAAADGLRGLGALPPQRLPDYGGLLAAETLGGVVSWLGDGLAKMQAHMAEMSEQRSRGIADAVRAYIDGNLNADLSVESIADALHYSREYVSRVFKKETGAGIGRYITDRRIETAKRLLCGTQDKISEIAARLGYESASYFASVFKNETGSPPKEYRAKNADARQQGGGCRAADKRL